MDKLDMNQDILTVDKALESVGNIEICKRQVKESSTKEN